jgi:DNA-binding GntR family transcriptional regulator
MTVLRSDDRFRTVAGIAREAQCSRETARRVIRSLESSGRVDADRGKWPHGYRLTAAAGPGTPMSA